MIVEQPVIEGLGPGAGLSAYIARLSAQGL